MNGSAAPQIPLLGNPGPAIAGARLVIAAVLGLYVLTYSAPPGYDVPAMTRAAAIVVVAALIVTSGIQLRARAGTQRRLGFVVIDAVAVLGLVVLYAFDPSKYLFFMTSGVVIEAALLLGLSGATFTWAALSCGYFLKETVASAVLGVPTEPVAGILRVLVLLGITLVVGSLVEAVRATKAFAGEREETERLRALDETKNAFLAAVSHDLKNPLTTILGFAATLEARLDKLPREQSLEFLRQITRSGRKLERMLDDLLDMDRIDRGIIQPNLMRGDIAALVRGIVQDIDLGGQSVTIHADEVRAEVDPAKLERIVENLIRNAIKYAPSEREIDVRVAGHGGGFLLAVEDRGPGIPDDLKEKVFEPFERAPGANGMATGSGIGLSLVSRFTELHGGRAWVEDRPGGGASFRVYLPGRAPAVPS